MSNMERGNGRAGRGRLGGWRGKKRSPVPIVASAMVRRALVTAPLVCHLMAFPKRYFDGQGIERAVDGLYWLRRRLD